MDYFIVGAAKAGTTLIWEWLRHHPKIFTPAVKEPHYYCFQNGVVPHASAEMDQHYLAKIVTSQSLYDALYREKKSDQLSGDASPGYLYYAETASHIKKANPKAKIICVLRDPTLRAFSQYMHHIRDGLESAHEFSEALTLEAERQRNGWWWGFHYCAAGKYAYQWQAYHDVFPSEQRLLLLYDDLQAHPEQIYFEICAFLNIDPQPNLDFNQHPNDTAHMSAVPRFAFLHRTLMHGSKFSSLLHKVLPEKRLRVMRDRLVHMNVAPLPILRDPVREELAHVYRFERQRLSDLIQRDLSHWN